MLINFVFPWDATPVRGQVVSVRAHADNFDPLFRKFKKSESLGLCGEVTDIQPHSNPDYQIVTVSITSEL